MLSSFSKIKVRYGAIIALFLAFFSFPTIAGASASVDLWAYDNLFEINPDACSLAYVSSTATCTNTYAQYYEAETMITKFTGPITNLQQLSLDETPEAGAKLYFFNPQIISGDCTKDENGIDVPSGSECFLGWGGLYNADSYGIINGAGTNWPWIPRSTVGNAFPDNIDFEVNPFIYAIYNGSWVFFDDPAGPFPYASSGYVFEPGANVPTISPFYPIAEQDNFLADLDFYATGTVSTFEGDDNIWDLITLVLIPINEFGEGFASVQSSKEFDPPIAPGGTEEYSFHLDLADGVYKIYYVLSTAGTLNQFYFPYSEDTIIRNIALPTSSNPFISGDYTDPTEEDCSSYGYPDKWLCEIKNTLAGLVLPSKEKLVQFKAVIGQVQEKAPFNYINIAVNNFKTIYSNIGNTPISITLWGNTETISGEVLTASGLTLVFQSFIGIIFIIIFLFWAVSFGKRLF